MRELPGLVHVVAGPLREVVVIQLQQPPQHRFVAYPADITSTAIPVRHLRLPVTGKGPAVQLARADLPGHVGRHVLVVLRAEGPRKFSLHGLRGRGHPIEPLALADRLLVGLVALVSHDDHLMAIRIALQ